MAVFSCLSTKRSFNYSPSMSWKAPMRLSVILAVATFASPAATLIRHSIPPDKRSPSPQNTRARSKPARRSSIIVASIGSTGSRGPAKKPSEAAGKGRSASIWSGQISPTRPASTYSAAHRYSMTSPRTLRRPCNQSQRAPQRARSDPQSRLPAPGTGRSVRRAQHWTQSNQRSCASSCSLPSRNSSPRRRRQIGPTKTCRPRTR